MNMAASFTDSPLPSSRPPMRIGPGDQFPPQTGRWTGSDVAGLLGGLRLDPYHELQCAVDVEFSHHRMPRKPGPSRAGRNGQQRLSKCNAHDPIQLPPAPRAQATDGCFVNGIAAGGCGIRPSNASKPTTNGSETLPLTAWRAEHDWLREGSVVAQQQMLRNFRAKESQGKGKRKFKSGRKTLPSLGYTRRGFSIKDGRLCVAGGRSFQSWCRELPRPSSVRIYRDNLGHWYASFVVERDEQPLPDSDAVIGIDWGVKVVATTTDKPTTSPILNLAAQPPKSLPAGNAPRPDADRPKASVAPTDTLRPSCRRRRYPNVSPASDGTHRPKWARSVVDNHGGIAVEDFKPAFLAKVAHGPQGWRRWDQLDQATLIEYAERAGRKVVLVKPAYTTMTCSGCGARAKSRLLLSERVFVCRGCGAVADRDRNAARVILDGAGLNLPVLKP